MNGRQPNEKSDLHDDEIIELKDVVQSGPEDDIIDLTEVLEQPEQAPSPGEQTAEATIAHEQPVSTEGADEAPMETDDDIIDLADLAAEPDAPAADASTAGAIEADDSDEEVIDLTDVAKTLESDISDTDWSVPGKPSAAARSAEDVIDLTDVADAEPAAEADAAPAVEATDQADDDHLDEEVIDLTDLAGDDQSVSTAETAEDGIDPFDDHMIDLTEPVSPDISAAAEADETDEALSDLESRANAMLQDTTYRFDYDPAIEAAETAGPDAGFTLLDAAAVATPASPSATDEERGEPEATSVWPASDDGIVLTDQQLEAALTATIEKIYGERIEQLLLETIEKTVRREIAKIKNALLEEDDDMIG